MDAKSRYFFHPDYVTRSSPVPYRESILKMAAEGFMAYALLPLFPRGVLSTRVNPDTSRILVDGQIRFEYATRGWKYF